MPDLVRDRLKALCVGRQSDEPLFGYTRGGDPVDRHWLHHHVERLCKACRIPVITTHSLRGLHATIANLNEVTPAVVAKSLGHMSPTVTDKHYTAPGTHEEISVHRVTSRLTQK